MWRSFWKIEDCPFEFDKLIFGLAKEEVKQVVSDKLVLSDFLEFLTLSAVFT